MSLQLYEDSDEWLIFFSSLLNQLPCPWAKSWAAVRRSCKVSYPISCTMFENILEVFGSCLLKSDTHETKRKIKRIVSVDVSVTCASTVVQLVKIKTSWQGGGRGSRKGVGIISPESHAYANIGDGGTTKYHWSVIPKLSVHFRGLLSTTKELFVPLLCIFI